MGRDTPLSSTEWSSLSSSSLNNMEFNSYKQIEQQWRRLTRFAWDAPCAWLGKYCEMWQLIALYTRFKWVCHTRILSSVALLTHFHAKKLFIDKTLSAVSRLRRLSPLRTFIQTEKRLEDWKFLTYRHFTGALFFLVWCIRGRWRWRRRWHITRWHFFSRLF